MSEETKVKQQIVGTCGGITEKPSGWTEFSIQVHGKQYPVKLSTKLDPLIEKGRAVGGGVATWTYTESEGAMNPRSGKPYTNRYLEDVEAGAKETQPETLGATMGANATTPLPEAKHEALHYADEKRVITRLALLKVAAQLAPLYPDSDDPVLTAMEIAGRLETWSYRDIDEVPFEEAATGSSETHSADAALPTAGGSAPIPTSWEEVRNLMSGYSAETLDLFERYGASARHYLFGDEGLSPDQKNELWLVACQAAVTIVNEVPLLDIPTEEQMTKAWASALDGQELQPVEKKEVPDAP